MWVETRERQLQPSSEWLVLTPTPSLLSVRVSSRIINVQLEIISLTTGYTRTGPCLVTQQIWLKGGRNVISQFCLDVVNVMRNAILMNATRKMDL